MIATTPRTTIQSDHHITFSSTDTTPETTTIESLTTPASTYSLSSSPSNEPSAHLFWQSTWGNPSHKPLQSQLKNYLVLVDIESGKHELSNTENLIGQQVRYTHRVAQFYFHSSSVLSAPWSLLQIRTNIQVMFVLYAVYVHFLSNFIYAWVQKLSVTNIAHNK